MMRGKARRPPVRHLVASGLLGFVMGAFVVASLGDVGARIRAVEPAAKGAVVAVTVPPLTVLNSIARFAGDRGYQLASQSENT